MHTNTLVIPGATVALVLIAAILSAGCMSSPSSQAPSTPAPVTTAPPVSMTMTVPTTPPGAATTQILSGNVNVTIQNYAFNPAAITVQPGTTVTWTNMDTVDHTVTSVGTSPASFDSRTLHPGATFQYTFNYAGTYTYGCTIHTFMRGTVTVP